MDRKFKIIIILFLSAIVLIAATFGYLKTTMSHNQYFDDENARFASAIQQQNLNSMEELLPKIDINEVGRNDMTFVNYAFIESKKESFSWLLDHRANPNKIIRDETGDTYMINRAVTFDDDFYLNKLLTVANLNVKDEDGNAPLHNAILATKRDRITILLNHGADINITDAHQETPLFLLCVLSNYKDAFELLAQGANPTIKDDRGLSILDLIKRDPLPPQTEIFGWQQKVKEAIQNSK